jgi:predicted Zn-dependent protease
MAHEIGHNSHDHFGQSLGRESIGGTFASIGWIAGPPGRKLTEGLKGIVAVQFTRGQEREADDRAVDYMRAAGLDPDGLARFFEAMERDFGHEGAQFFQTHPHPENRVKAIRDRIGTSAGGERSTPRFDAALARAREVLPYYAKLAEASSQEDPAVLLEAADAGATALPRHALFHFWRGVALESQEKSAEARAALRTATGLNFGNFFIPLVWGALEFKAEDWAATEEAANALLEIVPMPTAFFLRGIARVKQGRDAEGRKDLDFLVSLFPKKDREALLAEIRKHVPDFQVGG